jgi:hypothetical protein
MVYRNNKFSFTSVAQFHTFSYTIPQSHLNNIQTLELSSSFESWCLYAREDVPYNIKKYGDRWIRAWVTVAGMKGLKHLFVELFRNRHPLYRFEEDVLGPIKVVRHVEDFVVVVHWWNTKGFVLGDSPFRLVREAIDDE